MAPADKTELEELNKRVGNVEETLAQIRDAILGTEFNEKAAYKARIESLEDFKSKVEMKMLKAQIWGTAIGFLAFGLIELAVKYSTIISNMNVHK